MLGQVQVLASYALISIPSLTNLEEPDHACNVPHAVANAELLQVLRSLLAIVQMMKLMMALCLLIWKQHLADTTVYSAEYTLSAVHTVSALQQFFTLQLCWPPGAIAKACTETAILNECAQSQGEAQTGSDVRHIPKLAHRIIGSQWAWLQSYINPDKTYVPWMGH